MSAGTLSLTNNSAAVTGSGTTFTTELGAGDFIVVTVGGIPYTLAIKTLNSNTSLTLVSNYTGPTQAGAAWYAVPRVAMNLVTAALVAQSAEALRGLNYDKQNWQSIFSGTGNVSVTLPDGSSFTGPAWNSFTQALNGKMDKVTLGSSAFLNTGNNAGDVLTVGSMGTPTGTRGFFQTSQTNVVSRNWTDLTDIGLYDYVVQGGVGTGAPATNSDYFYVYNIRRTSAAFQQLAFPYATPTFAGRMLFRGNNGGTWSPWAEIYTTANTTKSSDGTIKAASPVARIVKSKQECERSDIAENGFIWCGCGTANAEAEGITVSRLDFGVYVITGSAGLASEGWQILPPMDPGGMGELGVVEAEQTESGGLTIRLFKRKYMLSDKGEIIKTKGEPMDVPANSWIDVRLDMPEDSLFNQRMNQVFQP